MVQLLTESQLPEAMELVWRVFQEFEAPDYSPEGVATFRQYIQIEAMADRFRSGELRLWGDWKGCVLRGVLALRESDPQQSHISLLFVDRPWQRQGIGRALLIAAQARCQEKSIAELTVHASPYGVEAYKHMGFFPLDPEREEDGIRYTPMLYRMSGNKRAKGGA